MKIAIDSGPLTSGHSVRGIGFYTKELLKAFDIDGVDISKADLGSYDIVHFTSFKPFEVSIPFSKPKGTKFVLTIYDLIPLIYPSHYPSGIKGNLRLLINKYLISKNIDAIITISETSKKDICRFFGVNPGKVFVTYLAARPIYKKMENGLHPEGRKWKAEISKRYNLPDRFALYVGDVNYNKNIPNLIEACKIAKIQLVIAGKQAKEIKDGKVNLNHPELSHLKSVDWSNVKCIGFVSDEDVVKVYNLAKVYIQPSLYEGFGMPVLEASACGIPVVAAKTQALVEILGTGARFVNPNDPKDIAKGILDPNIDIKLPRIYSWDETAKQTLEVYAHI